MLQRLARSSLAASRSHAVCVGDLTPTRLGCTRGSHNTSHSITWDVSTSSWASSSNCNNRTGRCSSNGRNSSSNSSSSILVPPNNQNVGYGQTRCFVASAATPAEGTSPIGHGPDAAGSSAAGHSINHVRLKSNIDICAVYRHHWAVPVVGFGTRLVLPLHSFEAWEGEEVQETEFIEVPSEVFGQPLRPDILHQVYWHTRRAIAGWTERMQLYKWEWPGSTRKIRPQSVKTGMARMGWRKACGKYLGVQTHPLRPHDQRTKCNKRLLWRGVEQALSAKFGQEQLVLVRDFNLTSHKTKHCVKHLRRLLGPRCSSALLIHEGHDDVNENFRWATAHITGVKRTDVAGVNAYTLLKHRMAIITIKALKQLLYQLHQQQQQRLPRYATPDGLPAPPPPQVPGWAQDWIELKTKEREAKFDRRRMRELAAKWKWSSDPKGLLKLPRADPLRGFRLSHFSSKEATPPGSKYDYLYADEDPLDEEEEDLEKLAAALEAREHEEALGLTNSQDIITSGESL